jgi:hypothetical protein
MPALTKSRHTATPRHLGHEGGDVMLIQDDVVGRASRCSVEQGTGFPMLDLAMGCVARRLKFAPGHLDGRAIAATVPKSIASRLDSTGGGPPAFAMLRPAPLSRWRPALAVNTAKR